MKLNKEELKSVLGGQYQVAYYYAECAYPEGGGCTVSVPNCDSISSACMQYCPGAAPIGCLVSGIQY